MGRRRYFKIVLAKCTSWIGWGEERGAMLFFFTDDDHEDQDDECDDYDELNDHDDY